MDSNNDRSSRASPEHPAAHRRPIVGAVPAPRQFGPSVWRGDSLTDRRLWSWSLAEEEIEELFCASAPYADADVETIVRITRGTFRLPVLGEKVDRLRRRLTAGRGFEVVRGVPVDAMSENQSMAAFVGLGAHLGRARPQNAAAELLGHVRNTGADATDPDVRIYQTASRQSFHTDSCDVVGLLCLETAAEGGESLVVSVGSIYNEMLGRDATLGAVLFDPIATDRRGEVPRDADPFFTIPVLSWYANELTVTYQRQYIESAQRFAGAPRLTPCVLAALDMFDEIANSPGMALAMHLEPGDMQFVHNHSLLHDRRAYVDRPGAPRHLLRLWLTVVGDRQLPPTFAQRFGSTTVGDRGGIVA